MATHDERILDFIFNPGTVAGGATVNTDAARR